MREGEPSRTAEYMALFRAVETARPGRRLCVDPWAVRFLGAPLRAVALLARVPGPAAVVRRLIDRRAPGPRVSAIVRTRLIDEALRDALAAGACQLVLLGAGYDSRALRIAGIERATVFEVDHPTTQAVKRRRLRRALGASPAPITFVAVDFACEDFGEALLAAGYDTAVPTVCIWEGVTNYLGAELVEATLGWLAAHAGPGSRLVFTYVDRGVLDGSIRFPGADPWLEAVRRAGEPFTFGLVPAAVPSFLAERGWRLLDDTSTAEALSRFTPVPRESPPPAFYRVALAALSPAAERVL